AEPAAYARAPYVRQPHETQFGVTDWHGSLRPRGHVLAELAATVPLLRLEELASHGPVPPRAAMLVPHEFVHPFDPAAFGLGQRSGPYRPVDAVRQSARDPAPLVRAWLNGFVLAARAGMTVAFERERLDHAWPEVSLLLLPAPLASTSDSLQHVRASYWQGASEFFGRGGTLYLSCSADVAIPGMRDLAGCRIADRAPGQGSGVLRFVTSWGPYRPGQELTLPHGDGSLASRGVRLDSEGAEVVAVDAQGEPALVMCRRGPGPARPWGLPPGGAPARRAPGPRAARPNPGPPPRPSGLPHPPPPLPPRPRPLRRPSPRCDDRIPSRARRRRDHAHQSRTKSS